MIKVEFFKDSDGKWRCRLVFRNGYIFATSEAYGALVKCEDSVRSLLSSIYNEEALISYIDKAPGRKEKSMITFMMEKEFIMEKE